MGSCNFIFDTFDDAMSYHKTLFEELRLHGVVTYAFAQNTYTGSIKLVGYEYYRYGWTWLGNLQVEPYLENKWIIRMPKTIKLF